MHEFEFFRDDVLAYGMGSCIEICIIDDRFGTSLFIEALIGCQSEVSSPVSVMVVCHADADLSLGPAG